MTTAAWVAWAGWVEWAAWTSESTLTSAFPREARLRKRAAGPRLLWGRRPYLADLKSHFEYARYEASHWKRLQNALARTATRLPRSDDLGEQTMSEDNARLGNTGL
jgi:hypothetical protein